MIMTKKKLLNIILNVVILVVMMDIGVRLGMNWYIRHHDIPGDYGKIEYMFKHVDAQIILMGSSICMNSINPEILEKNLGKKVFNGGINGQQLEFFDVMTEAVFNHSHPELMILVLRHNDLTVQGYGRLEMMNIYYNLGNAKLDNYLVEGKIKQKVLLNSALYKFNTYWWRILLYHFKSFDELAHGGFVGKPVPSILPQCIDNGADKIIPPVNHHKQQCLANILTACRKAGTRLWIVIPPEFYKRSNETDFSGLSYIQRFCDENNIPFINDLQHPDYIDHPEYFYDNDHLNVNGAEIYTKRILGILQKEGK